MGIINNANWSRLVLCADNVGDGTFWHFFRHPDSDPAARSGFEDDLDAYDFDEDVEIEARGPVSCPFHASLFLRPDARLREYERVAQKVYPGYLWEVAQMDCTVIPVEKAGIEREIERSLRASALAKLTEDEKRALGLL